MDIKRFAFNFDEYLSGHLSKQYKHNLMILQLSFLLWYN